MRLVQVITDYIRRSILTTQGDLVVRGVSQPERLAAGLLKTFLAGQGAGEIPAWEGHKLSDHGMATGVFVRTTAGNEVVTGVGFKPSLVIFLAYCGVTTNRNWSIGFDYLNGRMVILSFNEGTRIRVYPDYSIFIQRSAANYLRGKVTAVSNDGFTFTFALSGVSCADVVWLAVE